MSIRTLLPKGLIMTTQFSNRSNIPLSLAVWLCDDDYDHDDDPNTISATTLLKPIRAIVLARQNMQLNKVADVEGLIASRMGTALHTAIENTWKNHKKVVEILSNLGYNAEVIRNILINPAKEEISIDSICIYMEQRSSKKVGKFKITGKFDMVIEGALEDYKSTGTYNYISGSNKEKYKQQGSIYRWLNPTIITEDIMKIQYIFTDWSAMKARQDKKYPQKRLVEQRINLMSIPETETFVAGIVAKIEHCESLPQSDLPVCTSEELWRKPDVFKYYKDPLKKTRSTKNFDIYNEAVDRMIADGNTGVIDTIKGQVIRCKYCDVIGICDQAKQLVTEGSLVI